MLDVLVDDVVVLELDARRRAAEHIVDCQLATTASTTPCTHVYARTTRAEGEWTGARNDTRGENPSGGKVRLLG